MEYIREMLLRQRTALARLLLGGGPEEGAAQCPWFGERLPALRAALVTYVRAHFDEYSGGDRS